MPKRRPGPPKASPPVPVPKKRLPWNLMVAVLVSIAVYANSLANDFTGDDKDQIVRNPVVIQHQLAAAFTHGVWAFLGFHTNYYRPLQFVVYILLHALVGTHALLFHLFSVALHALNTVLVYRLGERLTGRAPAALAAALLFAADPIHTEAVDWIAAYPDLMVTTIVLAGVWWFVRQEGIVRGWAIVGHAALYLAALGTKETGVMLVPLYLAYQRIGLRRGFAEWKRNLIFYAAMLGALALCLAARFAALGGLAPTQGIFFRLTPPQFVLSAVVTAAQYAARLVVPGDLNYFHVFHPTVAIGLPFLIALLALAALAAAALHPATPAPVRYGIVWMGVTLAPALNLNGVGQNVFAERYLYLPSVGFAWIAGLAFAWWHGRQPRVAWTAGLVILCVFGRQIVLRNQDWRDDYALLRKTVTQSPDSAIMHNNLAGLYVHRDDFADALVEEREAVRAEPRSPLFHKQLGMLYMMSDPRAAANEFQMVLRLDPSDTAAAGMLQEAQQAERQR